MNLIAQPHEMIRVLAAGHFACLSAAKMPENRIFKEKRSMSTVFPITRKCVYCGKESEQRELSSTNAFGFSDMDFRPPEMERSTLPMQIEVCPHCGYAAFELEKKPRYFSALTPGLIESSEYKNCDGISFGTELAANYYRLGMITSDLADGNATISALCRAAWLCDDNGETENAMICRSMALSEISMKLETVCIDKDAEEYYTMLKADLLRRTNCFSEVWVTLRRTAVDNPEFMKGLKFQGYLAYKRDNRCHNWGECQAFCAEHPDDIDYRLLENGLKRIRENKALEYVAKYMNSVTKGGFEIEKYLAVDAVYYSEHNGFEITGGDAVNEKLRALERGRPTAVNAVPAVVVRKKNEEDDEAEEYCGKECLVLKYPDRRNMVQLAFVEQNEDELIERISIVSAEAFEFYE